MILPQRRSERTMPARTGRGLRLLRRSGTLAPATTSEPGTWEILLSPACNLMHYPAHLFTVRSCWLQRRQHCQLEGWPWGEHWSGDTSGGVRRVRERHVPTAAAYGVPFVR